MSAFSYQTIAAPAQGLYKEKGSRFISFAFPIVNEEDARVRIKTLKKEYFDARHHCFAWILGPEKRACRASDDGEPSHSAGDPILGQIRSRNLTYTLVVVVRYFGGIKLGVGGLSSAYKAAAEEALNHTLIVEKDVLCKFELFYTYTSVAEVMRVVKDFEIKIIDQKFNEACEMRGECRLLNSDSILGKIKLLQALGHQLQFTWVDS